jgi:hypothetical protein
MGRNLIFHLSPRGSLDNSCLRGNDAGVRMLHGSFKSTILGGTGAEANMNRKRARDDLLLRMATLGSCSGDLLEEKRLGSTHCDAGFPRLEHETEGVIKQGHHRQVPLVLSPLANGALRSVFHQLAALFKGLMQIETTHDIAERPSWCTQSSHPQVDEEGCLTASEVSRRQSFNPTRKLEFPRILPQR